MSPITSTRDLSLLAGIAPLKRLCQSLAMLDAILSPEWESRYYSFDDQWTEDESLASMRDGEGDEYFLLFSSAGAILKGFAHESRMSPYRSDPPQVWPGVLDEVPEAFASFLAEPAFPITDTTICIGRTHQDSAGRRGGIEFPDAADPEDSDGSAELLAMLDGKPETYQSWAETYYERLISLAAIAHIYEHQPLAQEVVSLLNPQLLLRDVAQDQAEIGY